VGLRAGLGLMEKRKISAPCQKLNPDSPDIKHIAMFAVLKTI
jgi:hypothetical protein